MKMAWQRGDAFPSGVFHGMDQIVGHSCLRSFSQAPPDPIDENRCKDGRIAIGFSSLSSKYVGSWARSPFFPTLPHHHV